MPTLPSEAHHRRDMAESFGADAERYDRTRPPYPAALIERILAAAPGRDLLDVGLGTGIDARQFQAAGCTVLGVEPDPRMAAYAESHGSAVEVAKFEEWEPAGRTFDVVAAGQAWHWVDPVTGAAKAASVLRPGGRLAVFWNVFEPPAALAQEFAAVYHRLLGISNALPGASGYGSFTDQAVAGIEQSGAYTEPEQWRFDWQREYTRAEWLDMVPTSGGFSRLPPGTQRDILDGIGAAITAPFTMDYVTLAVVAARLESPVT